MDNAQALVIAELSIGEYAPIRNVYKMEIEGAIMEYFLTEGVKITRFRNAFKRAITAAFGDAYELGYTDGGGDPLEMDPDDQAWINGAQQGEWGYCDTLFEQIKQLKKEGLSVQEYQDFASARAEGYAKTLDGVYSQGKIRGAGNVMLTFGGNDGAESCPECQAMKGKRHSSKWWVKRGLVPFRGNRNYSCAGFNCQHYLFSDKGEVYNI